MPSRQPEQHPQRRRPASPTRGRSRRQRRPRRHPAPRSRQPARKTCPRRGKDAPAGATTPVAQQLPFVVHRRPTNGQTPPCHAPRTTVTVDPNDPRSPKGGIGPSAPRPRTASPCAESPIAAPALGSGPTQHAPHRRRPPTATAVRSRDRIGGQSARDLSETTPLRGLTPDPLDNSRRQTRRP
jgi:hypothetical protein